MSAYIPRSQCKRLAGFNVLWCHNIPVIDGEAQMDDAEYRSKDFDTEADAIAFAHEIAKTAEWGYAKVCEFAMVPVSRDHPDVLEREYTGEETIIEKD